MSPSLRRSVFLLFLVSAIIMVSKSPAAAAVGCSIDLKVDPVVVHFPSALPAPNDGPTFGELVDANYSKTLDGKTIILQYLDGQRWEYLQNFTGNEVGFTVIPVGLNSAWTRMGVNTLRAVSGSCTSTSADFTVVVDSAAVPEDLAVYAVVALGGVAFFLLGRWTKLGVFLVIAAAVYLVLAPFTGQRYDIYFLASSGIRILQHVNPFDPGKPPIYPEPLKWAYPPLYAVYSSVSFLIYAALTGTALPKVSSLTWPGYLTSTYDVWEAFVPKSLPFLVLLLKIPMVISALGTGVLLKKMTGRDSAAVSWLANPIVILVGAVWGQLDPIATFFALAAFHYHGKDKPYHAYLLASLGAAVKVWPFVLVPLFLVEDLKKNGLKAVRPVSAVLPALAVTVALYAAFGNLVETLSVFLYARGIPTYGGEFTVNGLTWQQVLLVLRSPPVPLFLVLGIPLYLFILAYVYREGDDDLAKWTVVSLLIFYLTYNYVNPQYFYWIIPFLILQGKRLATWAFSALPLAYVALAYNVFYFVSPSILLDEFSIGPSIVEQLKLASFYSVPLPYLAVSAVVPTLVYLALLRNQLKRHAFDEGGPRRDGRRGAGR